MYFPNQTIFKRDTELFDPVFKEFKNLDPKFYWKRKAEETPFNIEDVNPNSLRHLIFDEFDAIFYESRQNMAVLNSTLSCGVTATAHRKDESHIEKEMLAKMEFDVIELFPQVNQLEAIDYTKKNYMDLREVLLEDAYSDHATLIIGTRQAIQSLSKDDFRSFVNVEDENGKVTTVLDQNQIYYLTNLKLARSIDFRPDGTYIKGIVLVIASPAPVWRNYQQWLGRVGRHGDKCQRI